MAHSSAHHPPDHYALLGVARTATAHEIKSAFRKQSMKTHPDRGGSNQEQVRINRAYEILSDPVKRKRYDRSLQAAKPRAPERPRYRSKRAEEWESGLSSKGSADNFGARVKQELKRRSDEIISGRAPMAGAMYEQYAGAFRKIRRRCIVSAAAAAACGAVGFVSPWIWAGVVAGGYAMYRYSRYGTGNDAVSVLDPEWDHVLSRRAADRIRRETDSMLSRLEELADFAARLVSGVKKRSSARDGEDAIVRRMLIHFFLLGFVPDVHDGKARILTLKGRDESIVLGYRKRAGGPVNVTFVKKLHGCMKANNISKGCITAPRGISKNAADFADSNGIAYYSIGELNSWIARMTPRRYPGPAGDILHHLDFFMRFMERMWSGHDLSNHPVI